MRAMDVELQKKLVAVVNTLGYEWVGCECINQGRQTTLRIYIDSAEGVTVDACALVSRQISAVIDVEAPIQSQYQLEVSSPGIDRPLFELEHYRKYIGSRVKLKLYSPINQRRQFKGILQHVEGELIYLQVDDIGEVIKLPFSEIDKANLIGELR